jgi:hypothetical protein
VADLDRALSPLPVSAAVHYQFFVLFSAQSFFRTISVRYWTAFAISSLVVHRFGCIGDYQIWLIAHCVILA